MTCTICGRGSPFADTDQRLICRDGALMPHDAFALFDPDDHPPCPRNPARCLTCGGAGGAMDDRDNWHDCPDCGASGWKVKPPSWADGWVAEVSTVTMKGDEA